MTKQSQNYMQMINCTEGRQNTPCRYKTKQISGRQHNNILCSLPEQINDRDSQSGKVLQNLNQQ